MQQGTIPYSAVLYAKFDSVIVEYQSDLSKFSDRYFLSVATFSGLVEDSS